MVCVRHEVFWLGGASDPARSFGCRANLRQHRAGVIEKGSTRRCQFNPARAVRVSFGRTVRRIKHLNEFSV
jgi:hypothetical protein